MKRSCRYWGPALIGLFLTVGFFAVRPHLWDEAEAASKSEPVAIIVGPEFEVSVGKTITVDGRLSYDPSGRKLHYKWELLEAPLDSSAKITKKNSATPSFTPDRHGRYVIQLTVHNGVKSSAGVSLALMTTYTNHDLIPVNSSVYQERNIPNTPAGNYGIQVGTNTYWAPAYYSGTETSTATGFQVLVLDRGSLDPVPATAIPGYTNNQSFGGNDLGYAAMTNFLETLTGTNLLVIISSIDDNSALDTYPGKSGLAAQIKRLGGTDDFTGVGSAGLNPYSLIGIPGLDAGNGFEMYGPKLQDPSSQTLQGLLTMDKNGKFQFIYPNFTQFETKSWKNTDGSYSGSIKVGDEEIFASIPGGKFPAGQGGFQVAYLMRENLDRQTVPMEYELNPMVYQTNVSDPVQVTRAINTLVSDLKKAAFSKSSTWPRPDCLIVIIQSIGVPFGAHSLYNAQSIRDLEKLINNLGGTEATFHAIFNNPGTDASPNKYSLLGIAADGMDTMPTAARLGAAESLEASTLTLNLDGTWTISSSSDGNVRGVINKNNQGFYAPFLATQGAAEVDLSLPTILFQDPTPWITHDDGFDEAPYLAAYEWISRYIEYPPGAQYPVIMGGVSGDLRSFYPESSNLWSTVLDDLAENSAMDQDARNGINDGTITDFNYAQFDFIRDQLHLEVQYTANVKSLFEDKVMGFLGDLHDYQDSIMDSIYRDAYTSLGIKGEQTPTDQKILNLFYPVIKQVSILGLINKSKIGPICGIAAAGIAIASHFIPDTATNPVAGTIKTTIDQLWSDLYTEYLQERFVAGKCYQLAVSDWGKLQQADRLWTLWSGDETIRNQALTAMLTGFQANIWQILIPIAGYKVELLPGTQCSVYGDFQRCSRTLPGNIDDSCDYIGSHANVSAPSYVRVASEAWDPLNVREAYDFYSIHQWGFSYNYLPDATLNKIFGAYDGTLTKLNVSKLDFFTRWPFDHLLYADYDIWCYTCGHLW